MYIQSWAGKLQSWKNWDWVKVIFCQLEDFHQVCSHRLHLFLIKILLSEIDLSIVNN